MSKASAGAAVGHRVACLVGGGGDRPGALERAGTRRRVRVRAGRRGLLARLELAAELVSLLRGQGAAQARPDVALLVVDVLAPGPDEVGEQLLELGRARVELVEP